ncbi:uncharacterized protein LOC118757396, partial [Rhagoletis pomonella]|uniref:uncharacterized protein LOC118757396 n=1 Tax=Rhagoletis pomonella TaxID=28610 RepID=UPI001784A49A
MQGGFELRNIVSNSNAVMEAVRSSASENRVSVSVEGIIEKILGMRWLPKPDVFVFTLKLNKVPGDILDFSRKPSKRETLAVNMSVFDPFGFLENYMIMTKILMQNIWKTSIDWNDPITDEIYRWWKLWRTELKRVEQIRIERCYFANFERASVELHIFADASEEALAVVSYWRVVDSGKVKVNFVAAKTSCAPTRFHTIPKMELKAAVMGVRLKESIIKCHEVN